MEAFNPFITGINKTFVTITNTNGGKRFTTTCIYIVYGEDYSTKVYTATASTDFYQELRRCHEIAEEIVKATLITQYYQKYDPVCAGKHLTTKLLGQKDVKTFSYFDRDVEIENHSHCIWYVNRQFLVKYNIVLKYRSSADITILSGMACHFSKGEAIRLARKYAELKIVNLTV